MNRTLQWLLLVSGIGCSKASTPPFVDIDAADAGPADATALDTGSVDATGPLEDLPGAGDVVTVFDTAVYDIQPLDAPPPPVDVGMDLAPLPDIPPDMGPVRVDHCHLTDPATADVAPGGMGPTVGAAVFVAGVTQGAGRGTGVEVQVGTGAGGTDPLTAGTWQWVSGTYDRDIDGAGAAGSLDDDRYTAAAPVPATPGEYAFAARARIHGGPWLACDLVPAVTHPWDPAFAGRLTVAVAGAPRVGYCNIQDPRMLAAHAGAMAPSPVYSRVYAAMVTTNGCSDVPTAFALSGQLGHGPAGSYPADATWTWVPAAYAHHRDTNNPLTEGDCQDIEYSATLTAPSTCSARTYAFRYRLGTGPWTYCRWAPPALGAPTTPTWDVWTPDLAGALTVTGCP